MKKIYRLIYKALIYYAKLKPQVYYFKLINGNIVACPPLCMTQSMFYMASKNIVSFQRQANKVDFLITRPEIDKLASGYNKKIVAGKDSIMKQLLLSSTGLNVDNSFEEMLKILIMRRDKNIYIDKHFLPIFVLTKGVEIKSKIDMSSSLDLKLLECLVGSKLVKYKSTKSITKDYRVFNALNSNDSIESLLLEYLERNKWDSYETY